MFSLFRGGGEHPSFESGGDLSEELFSQLSILEHLGAYGELQQWRQRRGDRKSKKENTNSTDR